MLSEILTVATVKIRIPCTTTTIKEEILIHLREDIRGLVSIQGVINDFIAAVNAEYYAGGQTQNHLAATHYPQYSNYFDVATPFYNGLQTPHYEVIHDKLMKNRIREVSSQSIIQMMRFCWVGSILPRIPSTAGLISR
jgi:hypothetical protein